MAAMEDAAFNSAIGSETARALLRRLALDDGMELWVAEVGEKIVQRVASNLSLAQPSRDMGGATSKRGAAKVSTGRLPLHGPFGLAAGKALIHSDSTEYSRPILERSGLVKVSTTTRTTGIDSHTGLRIADLRLLCSGRAYLKPNFQSDVARQQHGHCEYIPPIGACPPPPDNGFDGHLDTERRNNLGEPGAKVIDGSPENPAWSSTRPSRPLWELGDGQILLGHKRS